MNAKPYDEGEIAAFRKPEPVYGNGPMEEAIREDARVTRRWLATIDALRARLKALEASQADDDAMLRNALDDAEQYAMNVAETGGYGRWAYTRFLPAWATMAAAKFEEAKRVAAGRVSDA